MSYFAKASPELNRKVARALNVNADVIRSEMYGLLERNKVGRSNRMGPKRFRSAPGDPPARQFGRLQESVAVVKQATPDDLTADTGPRKEAFQGRAYYPAFLEFGTRTMAARPFVRPTADTVRKLFRRSGLKVA